MEQAQTKLSKYAAKQQRLATDPTFGTDSSKISPGQAGTNRPGTISLGLAGAIGIKSVTARREAMDAANPERQARLDKILKMQLEIRTLEHRIENAKAHIVKLTAAIERQKKLLQ